IRSGVYQARGRRGLSLLPRGTGPRIGHGGRIFARVGKSAARVQSRRRSRRGGSHRYDTAGAQVGLVRPARRVGQGLRTFFLPAIARRIADQARTITPTALLSGLARVCETIDWRAPLDRPLPNLA